MGWPSFSPPLSLNITDVEKFEVGKKLAGWEKTDWLFFLPGKRMTSQFLPRKGSGRPIPSPGKDWRGEKTDCYTSSINSD